MVLSTKWIRTELVDWPPQRDRLKIRVLGKGKQDLTMASYLNLKTRWKLRLMHDSWRAYDLPFWRVVNTPGNFWWDVPPGFPNPDRISDTKMLFSTPSFKTGICSKIDTRFRTWCR